MAQYKRNCTLIKRREEETKYVAAAAVAASQCKRAPSASHILEHTDTKKKIIFI